MLQTHPEIATLESNQDMGFDTSLNPVKDGPQIQLAFESAEERLQLRSVRCNDAGVFLNRDRLS